jgi:HEAT repeat protein
MNMPPRHTQREPQTLIADLISGEDDRAELAALELGTLGQAALDWLRPLFADPQAEHRWWAARTLSLVRSNEAHEALIAFLLDADSDVRACAAFALGESQSEEAIGPLAKLLNDPSVFVSAMASDALARIGQASTLTLIDRLKYGTAIERARAAKALLALLDSRSIPGLIAALDDESPVVQHYVSEALTRLGVGTILLKPQ